MSAPIPLRQDFDASELRGLSRRSKDGPQARRLLALAAIFDGATRNEAAKRRRASKSSGTLATGSAGVQASGTEFKNVFSELIGDVVDRLWEMHDLDRLLRRG